MVFNGIWSARCSWVGKSTAAWKGIGSGNQGRNELFKSIVKLDIEVMFFLVSFIAYPLFDYVEIY